MADELDEAALTAAYIAIEDALVDFRDSRISSPMSRNGFVIRERDGSPSSVIRIGSRDGIAVAIRAYLAALAPGKAREAIDSYMATHAPTETP